MDRSKDEEKTEKVNKNLNPFEKKVMEVFLDGDLPELEILRNQLEKATIKKRKFTGHGFFLDFDVPDDCPKLEKTAGQIDDISLSLKGLENGGGCVLFISDGKLAVLEGFAYDEDWPENITDFEVSYENKTRDLKEVEKALRS